MDGIKSHSSGLTIRHGISTSASSQPPPTSRDPIPGPISRLVLEVLMEVFKYCACEIPEDWLYQPRRRLDDPLPVLLPLVVASVSSQWRMVALSTPRLWATMCWELEEEKGLGSTIKLTEVWLERSRKVTLSLGLRCDFDCAPLLKLFLPESNRWRFIDFVMPPEMHNLVSAAVRGNLLNLVGMDLSVIYPFQEEDEDEDEDFQDINDPYLAYEFAPKLMSASLSSGLCLHTMALPSSNLTHWAGHGVANDLWVLLNGAASLESCTLLSEDAEHFAPGPTPTLPKQYLLHSHLKTLLTAAGDMAEFLEVADHLRLPNLQSLSLCFSRDPTPWSLPTLTSFLDRSPNLTYLNLLAPIGSERLSKMLEHTREVRTLHLFDRACEGDKLGDDWLFGHPPGPLLQGLPSTIIPNLQTLVIIMVSGFPWDRLFELLESRVPELDWSTGTSGNPPPQLRNLSLEYLRVDESPPLDDAIIRRFDAMKERGLNVRIQQRKHKI
ncbi:hypothetical protein BD779DRAFT_1670052 [Infundibulicybe gibba]|nr:hypothetical protein BD779DRAFT_1670052 [Infundibulicybe gibba]